MPWKVTKTKHFTAFFSRELSSCEAAGENRRCYNEDWRYLVSSHSVTVGGDRHRASFLRYETFTMHEGTGVDMTEYVLSTALCWDQNIKHKPDKDLYKSLCSRENLGGYLNGNVFYTQS